MSTRVLPIGGFMNFNVRMSELRRRFQPPPVPVTQPESTQDQQNAPVTLSDQSNPVHQARSVRRNLFGPIDHEENLKFVQDELAKISDADSRRWNFDFQREQPLDGRFTWSSAQGTYVPVAYEMPNLTSRLTHINPAPSTSETNPESRLPTAVPTTTSATTTATAPSTVTSEVNPLTSTLRTVTTASTTVTTNVVKAKQQPHKNISDPTPQIPCGSVTVITKKPAKETTGQLSSSLPKKTAEKSSTKQTHITEFLKIRKRPISPPEGSTSKREDPSPPPVLKKARTSS